MKKLTAGIFAGILTIVTVNAADAAIATKAYVDQQDNAQTTVINANKADIAQLKTDVQGNTTNITNLTTTVGADANSGLQKKVADLEKSVGEGGSVADQIAEALTDYSTTGQMNTELDKKQNKSTAAYSLGNAAGGWTPLTADELAAVQSKITAAGVTQITTNANDITTLKAKDTEIEGKIGDVAEGKTVVQMITDVQTAASGDVDEKLGDLPEGSTVSAELDKKQNLLNNTNVTTTGSGNAVTAVSAADGKVTVTMGNTFIPEFTETGETGTYVLTATVTDSGVTNYTWESIERGTATPTNP